MTTIKDALEPCPFCGSADIEAVDSLDFVACQKCGASLEDSEPSARELWNTRATLTTPAPGQDAWSYQIQHGPDGEANYAWVHDHNGDLVCTAKTHHAKQIVDAILPALPVAPVVDEAAIRADEREKCAKRAIYASENCGSRSFITEHGFSGLTERIAQAIRAGGGER